MFCPMGNTCNLNVASSSGFLSETSAMKRLETNHEADIRRLVAGLSEYFDVLQGHFIQLQIIIALLGIFLGFLLEY